MPAATTHYLFSLEAYNLLDKNTKEKITNKNMYYLGSQGPDIFFFHKAGISKDRLGYIGGLLHDNKVYDLIKSLFDYSKNDNDLLSYFYGFLAHYSLDSNAHPLIIYGSRHYKNSNEAENNNHCRIESYIDTYMLKKLGLTKKDYVVDKAVKITNSASLKLSKMYKEVIKQIYNIELKQKDIADAFKHTAIFLRLMRPNSKLKYRLFGLTEKLFLKGKPVCTSIMIYNDEILNSHQIMNHDHNEYHNEADNSITYTSSFDDCYQNGLATYKKITSIPLTKELFKLNFEGNKYE